MNARPVFIHAYSSLHPGTGQGAGVIDLPIAREAATGLPYLPGSSLKGVLRDACEDPTTREAVLGPETANISDANARAGAVLFSDQRLLLFPVRSLAGTMAWVTSPFVLQRFRRDCKRLGLDAPPAAPEVAATAARVTAGSALRIAAGGGMVVLEDLDLSVVADMAAAPVADMGCRARRRHGRRARRRHRRRARRRHGRRRARRRLGRLAGAAPLPQRRDVARPAGRPLVCRPRRHPQLPAGHGHRGHRPQPVDGEQDLRQPVVRRGAAGRVRSGRAGAGPTGGPGRP